MKGLLIGVARRWSGRGVSGSRRGNSRPLMAFAVAERRRERRGGTRRWDSSGRGRAACRALQARGARGCCASTRAAGGEGGAPRVALLAGGRGARASRKASSTAVSRSRGTRVAHSARGAWAGGQGGSAAAGEGARRRGRRATRRLSEAGWLGAAGSVRVRAGSGAWRRAALQRAGKGEREGRGRRRKKEKGGKWKKKKKKRRRERKRESERAPAIFAAATAGPVGHARCVVRSDGDARGARRKGRWNDG